MNIPSTYQGFVSHMVGRARELMASGEDFPNMIFVINSNTGKVIGVPVAGDQGQRDMAAETARDIVFELNADAVFSVMESWALEGENARRGNEIIEQYGSVGNSPFAIEVMLFVLETAEGCWSSLNKIEKIADSENGRSFTDLHFENVELAGRFSDLLKQVVPEGTTRH